MAALWLVLEWYGATSQVPWLFLLAAWILALLIFAGVYSWWNRAGLRLRLAVRGIRTAPGSPADDLPGHLLRNGPFPAPVFEADGIELELGLNTTGGSRGPAWINGYVGGKKLTFGTGLVPAKGWTRLEVLRELHRGPIGATGWTIGSSDPLGFFQGRRSFPDAEVALVLPRFRSLAGRRQTHELEASVAAPRSGSGNELFGIREYRRGDSLRRIHWRSSARHGELVVREYEPPGLRMLGIFVDPSPPSADVADQIARIAASEAWDCISEGGRVVLWAPGREPSHSPRDLWSQLEWLARYPSPSGGFAASSPLRGEQGETVVITASANAELLDVAGRARRRKVWVVGDAAVESDSPIERVGTQWPL